MLKPPRVFLSYSHLDAELCRQFERHLSILVRAGRITRWVDKELRGGDEWRAKIQEEMEAADILLFLVSANFMDSEFCFSTELTFGLERHRRGEAHVIPVYLKPCKYDRTPFSELQRLPAGSKAVSQSDLDTAFTEVIDGVDHVVEQILARRVAPPAVAAPKVGQIRIGPVDGQEYVWIPPGSFEMGCSPGDDECNAHEKPRHAVTITKGFWMMRTPVTVEAYEKFARATGRALPEKPRWTQTPRHPMVVMRWEDAAAYCSWADGRLPTEAEWEFAARAGTTDRHLGANLDDIAWYGDNSGDERLATSVLWSDQQEEYWALLEANNCRAHPVGEKKPNPWGLHDVLGNVWEWCADWFDHKYYHSCAPVDPKGPISGYLRVVRGGAWGNHLLYCRVSVRVRVGSMVRGDGLGFRCVIEAGLR